MQNNMAKKERGLFLAWVLGSLLCSACVEHAITVPWRVSASTSIQCELAGGSAVELDFCAMKIYKNVREVIQ